MVVRVLKRNSIKKGIHLDSVPETKKNEPEELTEEQEEEQLNEIMAEVAKIPDENIMEAFQQEAEKWDREGIHPMQNVQIDMFRVKHEVEVMIELLLDRLDVTEEEFEKRVQRRLLVRMIELRRAFMGVKIKAQIMQNLEQARIQPKAGMILPPGVRGG
jgi:hypothetical protein